jgi:hypothetical protein
MDLFLSYNSTDHSFVESIARRLRDEGLARAVPWFLDRWHLTPGMKWRPQLEETLSSCKAVAIFVGPGEMGSGQQREVDIALDLQCRNPNLPIIPVLLPGCEPPLGFLRQRKTLAMASREGTILSDSESGNWLGDPILNENGRDRLAIAALSPDGATVAVNYHTLGCMGLVDVARRELITILSPGHINGVTCAAFSPTMPILATGGHAEAPYYVVATALAPGSSATGRPAHCQDTLSISLACCTTIEGSVHETE